MELSRKKHLYTTQCQLQSPKAVESSKALHSWHLGWEMQTSGAGASGTPTPTLHTPEWSLQHSSFRIAGLPTIECEIHKVLVSKREPCGSHIIFYHLVPGSHTVTSAFTEAVTKVHPSSWEWRETPPLDGVREGSGRTLRVQKCHCNHFGRSQLNKYKKQTCKELTEDVKQLWV